MNTQLTILSSKSMQNPCEKFILTILLNIVILTLTINAQKAELVVQTGHTDKVYAIDFSSDGKILASTGAEDDETIRLWDVETRKELRSLSGHTEEINSIKFSPNNKVLASCGADQTIKLWNIEKGEVIRTLKGHEDNVISVAFSPNGLFLASNSYDETVRLWNLKTGELVKILDQNKLGNSIVSIAFSPDSKILAIGGEDSTIKLLEIPTGKLIKTLTGHIEEVQSVVFSPDGKTLASGSEDKTIKLWDVAKGILLQTITGHNDVVQTVKFSPDGKLLASGSWDKTIKIWDLKTGKDIHTLNGHTNSLTTIVFSPKKNMLASSSLDETIRIWDIDSGLEVSRFEGHTGNVNAITLSPNNKFFISESRNKINVWDLENGQQIRSFQNNSSNILTTLFSPDSNILAIGYENKTIELWDIVNGKKIQEFYVSSKYSSFFPLAFSADGKKLASSIDFNTIYLWDIDSGKLQRKIVEDNLNITSIAFSLDGKLLAGASQQSNKDIENKIVLWNIETGQQIQTIKGVTGSVNSIAFSINRKQLLISVDWGNQIELWELENGQKLESYKENSVKNNQQIKLQFPNFFTKSLVTNDGQFQITNGEHGKINLVEVRNNKLMATLVSLDEKDWVITTPDGLFNASSGGRKLLHYIVGLEPIDLEQMKDLYYVPNLLQKVLKGDPLPKVELFEKKDLFPTVEYEPLKPNQKQLTVKLTNRGGGIGQVQVLFNSKELVNDARPVGFDANSPHATLTVDLTKASVKAGEENKIEIVARNAAGSLSTRGTRGAEIVYQADGKKQTETPNIYVIAGGISNYTGDNLKLGFAAKDAENFAKAIEVGATKLLGDKSKVHIRLLTSNGDKSTTKFDVPDARISTATKANFEKAFTDFKNATPNDVFIVYLAGHGVSLKRNLDQINGDLYLYLTQEATQTDMSNEKFRKAMAISSEELKELIKQNKSLKQVLVLDTCAAGEVATSFVQKRNLRDDDARIRSIERLKDNTGFYVLMGSSADAVSYEASQYGQGLLTYSLLQGMKGAKLRENQFADVSMLFDYAQETVPNMAKNIGGIQRPLIITPNTSASFDIGQFTTNEQKLISLSSPKPLILRPNLQNKEQDYDDLELTKLLQTKLREANYVSGRGENAPLVFVEADDMVDAIKLSGSYSIKGDEITVTIRLIKNKIPLTNLTINGKKSDLNGLANKIMGEIIKGTANIN